MRLTKHFSGCWRVCVAMVSVTLCAGAQTLHTRPKVPTPPPHIPPAEQAMAAPPAVIAKGTYLSVAGTRIFPMKTGTKIEARLLTPIYVNNKLVLPVNTLLSGSVTALTPDHAERVWARLDGDFTPIDRPVVRFDGVETSGGVVAMAAGAAQAALPMVNLQAKSGNKRHSLLVKAWDGMKQRMAATKDFFTSPGLGNRVKVALYRQLPYHPQQIDAGTSWSFPLTDALPVKTLEASGQPTIYLPPQGKAKKKKKAQAAGQQTTSAAGQQTTSAAGQQTTKAAQGAHWLIHAELETPLNSRTARAGDAIEARVVAPVYEAGNAGHELAIPQGATLVGRVTMSKAARSFGRNGNLRFSFQQLKLPTKPTQSVQGSVTGAMAAGGKAMAMDAEGDVSQKNNGGLLAPIALGLLAGRALDTDGNMTAQTGVASNGFGAVGRVVGITAGSRALAAGIGFYAVGLNISSTRLRHGREVDFPAGTRIDIETAPLNEPVLQPQTGSVVSSGSRTP